MGVNFKFEMDPNWERNLKREMADKVEREYQAAFDRLGRQYKGADLAVIRRALKEEGIVGSDGEPDDSWAEAIRDGVRIRPDVSQWR